MDLDYKLYITVISIIMKEILQRVQSLSKLAIIWTTGRYHTDSLLQEIQACWLSSLDSLVMAMSGKGKHTCSSVAVMCLFSELERSFPQPVAHTLDLALSTIHNSQPSYISRDYTKNCSCSSNSAKELYPPAFWEWLVHVSPSHVQGIGDIHYD